MSAALMLQGRCMGTVLGLSGAKRTKVKKIPDAKGIRATERLGS